MRTVIAYRDGKAIWSDSTPSYARLSGFGGRSIEEQPVQRREPTSDQARQHKARRDAEREA